MFCLAVLSALYGIPCTIRKLRQCFHTRHVHAGLWNLESGEVNSIEFDADPRY